MPAQRQEIQQQYMLRAHRILRVLVFCIFGIIALSGICFHLLGIDFREYLSHFSLCAFRAVTGIQCPGCGMTRAFLSLGQLKLKEAIQFNPFSLFLLITMILYTCIGQSPSWLQNKVLIRITLIVVITVWLLRLINT
jgi:hypothetical protein